MRYVLNRGCYVSAAVLFVALAALWGHNAAAFVLVSQTSGGYSLGSVGTVPNFNGQIFTIPYAVTVSQVSFQTLAGIAGANVHKIALVSASGTVYLMENVTSPAGSEVVYDVTDTTIPEGTYFIGSQYVSGSGATLTGTTTDPYYGGCRVSYASGTLPSCSGNTSDLGFTISGSLASSSGSVAISDPIPGSTIKEFKFWSVDYSIAGSGQYSIIVYAATSSAALYATSGSQYSVVGVSGSTTEAGLPVFRPDVFCVTENECPTPTGTLWYARAEIQDEGGTAFATSGEISFNVLFDPGQPPGAFECVSGDVVCKTLRWVFYPSDNVLENWNMLWTNVKNKPPFGYVTAAANVIGTLGTSTTSTFSLPPELADLPFWDPIKATLSVLIYFLGAFWLFHFGANIKL